MPQNPRWINTRLEYDWHGNLIVRERFWDYGPFLDAGGASIDAANWAFHNDGTESGATFIDSADTSPAKGTLVNGTIYQFRQGVNETAGGGWMNATVQLQYNINGGGYTNVTGSSNVIQSVATGNIADGADTTQRITGFTYENTNGGFDEVDGLAGDGVVDPSNSGFESLFSFQIIDGDVSDDDEIEIRVVIGGGTPFDSYPGSAHITVEKVEAPIHEDSASLIANATMATVADVTFEGITTDVTANATTGQVADVTFEAVAADMTANATMAAAEDHISAQLDWFVQYHNPTLRRPRLIPVGTTQTVEIVIVEESTDAYGYYPDLFPPRHRQNLGGLFHTPEADEAGIFNESATMDADAIATAAADVTFEAVATDIAADAIATAAADVTFEAIATDMTAEATIDVVGEIVSSQLDWYVQHPGPQIGRLPRQNLGGIFRAAQGDPEGIFNESATMDADATIDAVTDITFEAATSDMTADATVTAIDELISSALDFYVQHPWPTLRISQRNFGGFFGVESQGEELNESATIDANATLNAAADATFEATVATTADATIDADVDATFEAVAALAANATMIAEGEIEGAAVHGNLIGQISAGPRIKGVVRGTPQNRGEVSGRTRMKGNINTGD